MKIRAHETFYIRRGWLRKGIKNISVNPRLFTNREINPCEVLGIGTNIKDNPATEFRNDHGGNLLFRPVAQRPFVLCALSLYESLHDFDKVMLVLNKVNYTITDRVWEYIVWNPIARKMITSSNATLIELMLKFFTRVDLTDKELNTMVDEYKSMKGNASLTKDEIIRMLDGYVVD